MFKIIALNHNKSHKGLHSCKSSFGRFVSLSEMCQKLFRNVRHQMKLTAIYFQLYAMNQRYDFDLFCHKTPFDLKSPKNAQILLLYFLYSCTVDSFFVFHFSFRRNYSLNKSHIRMNKILRNNKNITRRTHHYDSVSTEFLCLELRYILH